MPVVLNPNGNWLILSQSLFHHDIISYYKCGLYKYISEEVFLTRDRCCGWDSQISWQAMELFLTQRNLVDEPKPQYYKDAQMQKYSGRRMQQVHYSDLQVEVWQERLWMKNPVGCWWPALVFQLWDKTIIQNYICHIYMHNDNIK